MQWVLSFLSLFLRFSATSSSFCFLCLSFYFLQLYVFWILLLIYGWKWYNIDVVAMVVFFLLKQNFCSLKCLTKLNAETNCFSFSQKKTLEIIQLYHFELNVWNPSLLVLVAFESVLSHLPTRIYKFIKTICAFRSDFLQFFTRFFPSSNVSLFFYLFFSF